MIETVLRHIRQFPTQVFLLLIGALLFVPMIGNVHLFDWDEINFAESAREMLLTHNYRMVQINFEPFFEKPPLFIWLQALAMKIYGVNEFAARLPNALCGIVTLLVVFNVGRYLFSRNMGVLWALLFACSILPHLYFKSGIIDPVFNLFIFLGIFFMFKLSTHNEFESNKERRKIRRTSLMLSAVFIGLATLTKGPVAILISGLVIMTYFVAHRGKLKIGVSDIAIWSTIILMIIFAWLSFSLRESGWKFIDEFLRYQIRLLTTEDAGHGGPFFYHFLVLLIGVFPASALIFESFRKNQHDDETQVIFKKWMIYLLLVVLILFSIVRTKIIHYSSLCYFPITFLAAYYLHHLLKGTAKWNWRQTIPVFTIALLITGAVTAGVFVMRNPAFVIPYIKDPFAVANLQAKVYWMESDIIYGIVYLICVGVALMLMQTRHVKSGIATLLISSGLFINTLMVLIVPRVEKYSQAALIEFLESKQSENCKIETVGFKSYAHYFYARKPLSIPTDAKHYLITKIHKVPELKALFPSAIELYSKNGWVFFEEPR